MASIRPNKKTDPQRVEVLAGTRFWAFHADVLFDFRMRRLFTATSAGLYFFLASRTSTVGVVSESIGRLRRTYALLSVDEFASALQSLHQNGLIVLDEGAEEIFVPWVFEVDRLMIMTKNNFTGASRVMRAATSPRIRLALAYALKARLEDGTILRSLRPAARQLALELSGSPAMLRYDARAQFHRLNDLAPVERQDIDAWLLEARSATRDGHRGAAQDDIEGEAA
ncbi:hypothetical protein [Curtobacterium ammoniigenes]|uniref:hypothetical protein n=1 Tax=Curtobacterium ammoniigenes TaxID=395387 RepID=UPI000AD79B76|nr:hypothetical protein [Curtobacterium ammoniigenes]